MAWNADQARLAEADDSTRQDSTGPRQLRGIGLVVAIRVRGRGPSGEDRIVDPIPQPMAWQGGGAVTNAVHNRAAAVMCVTSTLAGRGS